MAHLIVYSDASYNQPTERHPTQPLLHTIGAYVATGTDWRRFRKEWRGELAKKKHSYFHMTDFEYAQNAAITGRPLKDSHPYYGWRREEYVPFLKRLHGVINRKRRDGSFRMNAFIASLVKPDFDKTVPQELKDDPGCCSHYIFNVVNVMEQIAQWADRNNYHGPIHYVFAGGDDGAPRNLENWFDYCFKSKTATKKFRLSNIHSSKGYEIEWMKFEPGLQAADISAYEFNKLAIKGAERGNFEIDEIELRKSLINLCRTSHRGGLLTEKELVKAFSQMIEFKKKHGSGFID
jgi:hypothetical protein